MESGMQGSCKTQEELEEARQAICSSAGLLPWGKMGKDEDGISECFSWASRNP